MFKEVYFLFLQLSILIQFSYLNDPNCFFVIESFHSQQVLTVRENSFEKGANIVQYPYQGFEYQKWILEPQGREGYFVKSKSSGQYLDIWGKIILSKIHLIQYPKNEQENQIFKFIYLNEDSGWLIRVAHSHKYLSVKKQSLEWNKNIIQRRFHNLPSQKWRVLKYFWPRSSCFYITSVKSNLLLAIQDGSSKEGAKVIQRKMNRDRSEQWLFDYKNHQNFYIINKKSNFAFDFNGNSVRLGENLIQYPIHKSTHQLFSISPIEENYFRIDYHKSKNTLSVNEGSMEEGAKIEQQAWIAGDHQKWKFHEC